MPALSDPQRLELLKLLQDRPQMSQRGLALAMGVSLGKANYCLKALMQKGLVKLGRFRANPDKHQYAYLLTTAGLREKTRITVEFLKVKVSEYEALEKKSNSFAEIWAITLVALREALTKKLKSGELPHTSRRPACPLRRRGTAVDIARRVPHKICRHQLS